MLIAFGFKFHERIPPVFQHLAKNDPELELREGSDKFKMNKVTIEDNWRKLHNLINNKHDNDCNVNLIRKFCLFDKIQCLNSVLFENNEYLDNHNLHTCNCSYSHNHNQDDSKEDMDKGDIKIDIDNCTYESDCRTNIDYNVNFITMNPSLAATQEELEMAAKMTYNKPLKFNDFRYLKAMEEWKPRLYFDLYNETIKLIKEFPDLFAKYTCDRRTLNVDPVRLGIKQEYRNVHIRTEQYPLNRKKRIQMINYTTECDKNGFWIEMNCSINNNPYTMILKAPDAQGHQRGRPVFDFRKLNTICELIESYMPNMHDFDEFFAQPGLITVFDFKNYFDCIPLHSDDWIFAVVSTPLGIRKMMHLSYGFKNAAPHAQRIMNELSMKVPYMMGYIDDGTLKHPLTWNTPRLINHLRILFTEALKYNLYFHPEKFWPFITAIDCVGFHRTLYGSRMTQRYTKKILALPKPHITADLRTAIGVYTYVARYIIKFAFFIYWLVQLVNKFEDKARIKWTREADQAWDALKILVAESPILYAPDMSGTFCVSSDACSYAVGGVLYQKQKDEKGNLVWRMCDMYSQIMPKHLRDQHCKMQEAYGITKLIQHWTVYLIKQPFIVATDHKPLLQILDPQYDLSAPALRQLLRIRLTIAEFEFVIKHVNGIDHQLTDALSRLRAKLINIHKDVTIAISSDSINENKLSDLELEQLNKKLKQFQNRVNKIRKQCCTIIDNSANINGNYQVNNATVIQYKNQINKSIVDKLVHSMSYKSRYIVNNVLHEFDNYIPSHRYFEPIVELETYKDIIYAIDDINNCSKDTHRAIITINKQLREETIAKIDTTQYTQKYESKNSMVNGPITRSQTRQQRENEQKQKSINNEIKFVEPEVHNLRERKRLRDKLLDTLFAHRNVTSIFKFKLWPDLQRSDEQLNLIYRYITDAESMFMNEDLVNQWNELRKNVASLVHAAERREIKFDSRGILKIKRINPISNKYSWLFIVPTTLRGIIMDYSHHNPGMQHFGQIATLDNLNNWFWWPGMRTDARNYVAKCLICQFAKGGPIHRVPMQIRDLPDAREHLMADFMGPFFKRYYILVLVDYRSGFTVLVPTCNCGAITTSEAIIHHWIPYFGWFKTFESDMGSAFTAKLTKLLHKAMEVEQNFAEPRYHQSIGKVERVIGFLQTILRTYNIEFDNRFVSTHNATIQWTTLKSIIPFIQYSCNRKRSAWTTYSPAMVMYGSQFNSVPDIAVAIENIEQGLNTQKFRKDDHQYLTNLVYRLGKIRIRQFKQWKKYCLISKKQYDRRYNLVPQRDKDGNIIKFKHNFGYTPLSSFKTGVKVLYYIGPHKGVNGKWRQRWTGPWRIAENSNAYNTKIMDNKGNARNVSLDRLKLFKQKDLEKLEKWSNYEKQLNKLNKNKNYLSDEDE